MKKAIFSLLIIFLALINSFSQQNKFFRLTGSYLEQTPPGMIPEIFAPGIISKAGFHLHSCLAFSPDGNEVYFTMRTYEPRIKDAIYFMKKVENLWTAPTLAEFSKEFNNDSPVFTPDGNLLYFSSDRPVSSNDTINDLNFWFVIRDEEHWSEPKIACPILNSDYCDFRMSVSKNATLYFSSDRDQKGDGSFDIYTSFPAGEKYDNIVKLGEEINSSLTEQIGFIAPDESYLVFYRYNKNRPDDVGLYISFRDENGFWSRGINMGEIFNSPTELCTQAASLSPDGKYLFFLRRYDEAIYWVDAKIIQELKSKK